MGFNIALAGNPNCGKTTMFNELTGANQYVGNWPGVTVEKKEGKYNRDKDVTITDLPGVYSLSPYSPEEIVTRDYLMSGAPDVVVNLVDATNLERNLYLTTQIINLGLPVVVALNMMDLVEKNGDRIDVAKLSEMLGCPVVTTSALNTQIINLGLPVVVALNMMDLVEKNGDRIDVAKLSEMLGCPVVTTSALKGRGMQEVVDEALAAAKRGAPASSPLRFGDDVELALAKVIDVLDGRVSSDRARWYAVKLFEGEQLTIDALGLPAADLAKVDAIREAVEDAFDDDAESIITNERYDAIGAVHDACVVKSTKGMTTTQKIDRVVTNRVLGLPIFAAIMFLVYFIAVSVGGGIVTDWANDGISGDGWLYTGGAQYEEAVGAWEESVAAAEESGASEEALAVLAEEEPDRHLRRRLALHGRRPVRRGRRRVGGVRRGG